MAIFGSSSTERESPEWREAERAGARCAQAGLTVVTGGYGGTMEAASKGAAEAGGEVIGVTAPSLFPGRSGANRFVTKEIPTSELAKRIGILTRLAHGAIVMPGSIGTATELMVSWNLNHIARVGAGSRFPTAAVGDEWRGLSTLLSDRLGAVAEDIHLVETADEAVEWLLDQPGIR
ncbi:MAG: LOG family protein [Acidimicrobiia bacterium]